MRILSLLFLLISPLILFAQKPIEQYSLEQLDSIYQKEKAPKTKLVYALALLQKTGKTVGVQDTLYAEALRKVGSAYINISIDSSILYTTRAIEIQKVKIPKHADYAKSLNNLGIAYYYLSDLAKTEEYWLQAAAIRKEVLGETHISYLGSLVNLGNLFMGSGNYSKAINNYIQAKQIFEKQDLTTHKFYLICLTNLGLVHEKLTEYEKAERFYLQTLNVQKEVLGEEHPTYLLSLAHLASLYKLMGNYEKAESFLLQVLALKKEILGEGHYSYAETLNSLGNLYLATKNYQAAERFYLMDLELTKKNHGEKNTQFATSLGNIGILYRRIKNYEKAERFLLQALEIKKEVLDEQHPDYAGGLIHLGNLYADIGQYEKTEALYLEAYKIRKEIFSPKNDAVILSLNNLAAVYNDMNQLDLTWEYLLRAIHANTDLVLSKNINESWIDKFLKANHVSLEHTNTSLVIIDQLLSKKITENTKTQQVLICDLALQLLKKKKNSFSADSDKLRILSESANWVLRSMQVLDKNEEAAKALNIAEQNKSVLLLDAASNKRAYNLGLLPDSITQQEKALEKKYTNTKAALAGKNTAKQLDSIRNIFMDLNFEIDEFKKNIKENYPKYATTKYQYDAIQASEIQALLDDNTAMLEYLIGDSIVYVFYVDKTQVKIHEFAVDNKQLKHRIHTLHKVLSNYSFLKNNKLSYQRYTNQAYWFYEKLVAPALLEAKNIAQLIVISDGELGHLPFEAFLVEQAPQEVSDYNQLHYLIQDYRISYNYSATLWKENKTNKKRQNNGQILGLAADYNERIDSSISSPRIPADIRVRNALSPLTAARKEVELLSENFSGLFVFDTLASERFFKEKAPTYAVIHLAMHGILNKQEPMLSSLAFTEDNDSLENNFLQAYEISKMELNADLVVLSACETGFGKFERGNGIASLARAFMYAGAPAMIVSLWQVNDYTTSAIMEIFYYNLAKGMHKDEALRQAKMQFIESSEGITAHPAFWSPFVLIGNDSPTLISRKGTFLPWAIGGGILLVLLGTLILRRRKQKNG